jgi:hypothetical protein
MAWKLSPGFNMAGEIINPDASLLRQMFVT